MYDLQGERRQSSASFQKMSEGISVSVFFFDPDCKKELYVAELTARRRQTGEDWASFRVALRTLADKAYSDLEEKARERLALNQFLAQIENSQVAFGVKQWRPKNVEEAVAATIELESYLPSAGRPLLPTIACH